MGNRQVIENRKTDTQEKKIIKFFKNVWSYKDSGNSKRMKSDEIEKVQAIK